MASVSNRLYAFGGFRLDSRRRLLLRGDEVIPLTPKALDTLLVLVENAGRVIEKDELIQQVWDGAAVEEVGLAKNVSALRKVLGENPGKNQFIATVPGKGYQFVAEVTATAADAPGVIDEEVIETRTVSRIVTETEIVADDPSTGTVLNVPARWPQSPAMLPAPAARTNTLLRIAASCVAVILLAGAGAVYYRSTQAALTEPETVLVADFVNQTGDPVFDLTLREGLAAQLEQSPLLDVLSDERIRATLRLMLRDPNERVSDEVAREICVRQGVKAMISGIIAPIGSHYAITLRATDSQTGKALARVQEEADSKEQVLQGLSRAAAGLRGKLGESVRSIQKFDALSEATTASLEALRAYSLARQMRGRGDREEAIRLLNRAVELDPNFAMAYDDLAVVYNNAREPKLSAEYATKAYQARAHTSERERLLIESTYYGEVTGNLEKRIEVLTLHQQTFPRDPAPFSNLAGTYNALGEFEKAVPMSRRALEIDPSTTARFAVLGNSLIRLGQLDEASEVYRQAAERRVDSPSFHQGLFRIAFLKGDEAGMQAQVKWAAAKGLEDNAFDWQAAGAAARGEWTRSLALTHRAVEAVRGKENSEVAAGYAAQSALRGAALDKCDGAKAGATEALGIERNQVSLTRSALALAWCGNESGAASILEELSKLYPENTVVNAIWIPTARAAIEWKRGQAAAAIDLLRPVERYEGAGEFWPQYIRGQSSLGLKKAPEAEAEFRKILDHRSQDPISPLYALAQLGLARAADLKGDAEQARRSYEEFLARWKQADQNLPPLLEAQAQAKASPGR